MTRLLPAIALITAALGCGPEPEGPTAPATEPVLAATAAALPLRQISAGAIHTCAVSPDNRAFCWGWNVFGQVGNGSTSFERLTPARVVGGLSFREVSAGYYSSCGVTTADRAWCWGHNGEGQLGSGTTTSSTTPVAVTGGLRFRQVSVGPEHACGVTTDDRAFCWGLNTFGKLGSGGLDNLDNVIPFPMAVVGGLRFRQVSVGAYHSCGVTTTDQAYCWGGDQWGQLGDGPSSGTCPLPINTAPCRRRPTLVTGGHKFRQVDAGGGLGPGEDGGGDDGGRTCGVTTDDKAYCWGDGSHGQNGDGTRSMRDAPRLVAGGMLFRRVSTGHWHTCALTTDSRAYCWGRNLSGQLGDGTQTLRLAPRAVVGGLRFRQVSAGNAATCGTTTTAVAYCWGQYVGDGTSEFRLRPRQVNGTM